MIYNPFSALPAAPRDPRCNYMGHRLEAYATLRMPGSGNPHSPFVLSVLFAANKSQGAGLNNKLNEPAVDGLQGSAAPAKDADPLAGTAVVGVALDGLHPVPDDP